MQLIKLISTLLEHQDKLVEKNSVRWKKSVGKIILPHTLQNS